MKRDGKIELLRFIFSLGVVGTHILLHVVGLDTLPQRTGAIIPGINGVVAVEFFFVLSGLLMYKSIKMEGEGISLGQSTWRFMGKKVYSLLFLHFAVFIVYFPLCYVLYKHVGGAVLVGRFFGNIPGLFFLQRSGFGENYVNSVEWYLSSMLIGMLLLYPINKKFKKIYTRIIAPILVVAIYGYIFYETGHIHGVSTWMTVTYKCNLRAIAGLALGAVCGEVAKTISNHEFSKKSKILLGVLELAVWICALAYLCIRMPDSYQIGEIALIAAGLTLSSSQIDKKEKIFGNAFFRYLGRLSLPIYLSHMIAVVAVLVFCKNGTTAYKVLISAGGAFVIAVILERLNFLFYKKLAERKAKKGGKIIA